MLIIMNNSVYRNLSSSGIDLNDVIKRTTERCFSTDLKKLSKGQRILFGLVGKSIQSLDGRSNRYNPYCATTIIPIQPIKTMTTIYAIDSSSTRIGETDDGSIYAIKCGIVVACNCETLLHYKLGPLISYLSRENVRNSELDHKLVNLILFDHESAERLMRVRTERSIQYELSKRFNNSIILVDGSLRASPLESSQQNLMKIVENCCVNKNSLIGITKKTNLRLLRSILTPLSKSSSPAYMDVDAIIKGLMGDLIGNNTLVKFGGNASPILRADIVDPEGNRDVTLGKLLGNDSTINGYPDSLRLAHHISTFAPTEIACLKGYLVSKYGLVEVQPENIRSTLLGSVSL